MASIARLVRDAMIDGHRSNMRAVVSASASRRLRMHTDASIVATVKRVTDAPSSSMFLGFNSNKYQIIGTDALPRPATSIMFDWSHTYLQGGFRPLLPPPPAPHKKT